MAAAVTARPAIFFDLDNTLIATRAADEAACAEMVVILKEKYGIPIDDATTTVSTFLQKFRRCPDNPDYDLDLWRIRLWNQALGEEYCHLGSQIYPQWLKLRFHFLALKPEVLYLLNSLRKSYLLGLITNGPSRAQWEKVQQLHLSDYFDCILVSGDLPWEKPDQKIFQEACHSLGVEPKHCIMVGDKLETDIQGGKEAELGGTVWIPLRSEVCKSELQVVPDFTLDSVTQLPEVLPIDTTACRENISNDEDNFFCYIDEIS